MSLSLVFKGGENAGQRFQFAGKRYVRVGTSPTADVVVADDPLLQPEHFAIEEVGPSDYQLHDLTAQGSTKVNDRPVSKAKLHQDDVIHAGLSVFQVSFDDASEGQRPTVESPADALAASSEDRSRQQDAPSGNEGCSEGAADGGGDREAEPGQAADSRPAMPSVSVSNAHAFSSSEQLADDPAGTLSAHGFEVLEEVGRGTFGRIYKARQRSDGRVVALKVLDGIPVESAERMKFFVREMRIHEKLDHPHIVRYLGCGEAPELAWIAMEFVDGLTLSQFVHARGGAVPVRLACTLVEQVLSALDYAHRFAPPEGPFVHRDIKPSNILVASGSEGYQAKLCDFGLAKNFETAGFSGITATGRSRGSLEYMSPEQAEDSKYSGPEVDIYAMGGVLYFCLTGERMYDVGAEASTVEILQAKTEHRIVPINARRDDAPESLQSIVDRAIGRDAIRRFRTAGQMRHALAGAMGEIAGPG